MERRELTVLENEIHDLATAFHGILEWKWDGRFKTVLAEFSVDKQREILAILEEPLVHKWDSSSVSEAPPAVQDIVGTLGGLMPGQLLFHSGPEKPPFLFCAWWPWGNGRTISIRIAPFGKTLSDEEASALTAAFRDRFDACPFHGSDPPLGSRAPFRVAIHRALEHAPAYPVSGGSSHSRFRSGIRPRTPNGSLTLPNKAPYCVKSA